MNQKRCLKIYIAISIALVLLITRIGWLQSRNSGELAKAAAAKRVSDFAIDIPRGEIVDRNNIPLTNRSPKKLLLLRSEFILEDKPNTDFISSVIGITPQALTDNLRKTKGPVIYDIKNEDESKLAKIDHKVYSVIELLNRYDENSVATHLLGYLNKKDGIGATGIERVYNEILKVDGETYVGYIRDAKYQPVNGLGYRLGTSWTEESKKNVKLTLDYHIQKIAEDILGKTEMSGAVVIEKVGSGEIVTMASMPDFNQNDISKYLDDTNKSLFNRVSASYSLGSVFKIIDAADILEENLEFNTSYYCNGRITVGANEFKCATYLKGGHGNVDFMSAFASSCNTFFINQMVNRDFSKLIETADKFGMGKNTGIEKQGINESKGTLPDATKWFSQGDIANSAIGQGKVTATPVQVAGFAAIIASGGVRYETSIVDCVLDSQENVIKSFKNQGSERVISEATALKIKSMMGLVTGENGTGKKANVDEFGGAGCKTGTAQSGQKINGKEIMHGWITGFFPYDNPKYAMSVFIDNVDNGTSSPSSIFGDIAREILKRKL